MSVKISRAVYRNVSFWGMTINDLIFVVLILLMGTLMRIDGFYLLLTLVVAVAGVKIFQRYKEQIGRAINFKVAPEMISIHRNHPLCRMAKKHSQREL